MTELRIIKVVKLYPRLIHCSPVACVAKYGPVGLACQSLEPNIKYQSFISFQKKTMVPFFLTCINMIFLPFIVVIPKLIE